MHDATRRLRAGLALAAAAYVVWGLLSPLSKRLLDHFEPMTLQAVRAGLTLALAAAIVGPRATWSGLRLLRRPPILAIALMGGAFSLALFQFALDRQSATFTTLAFYTAPLWTALLARVALQERLGLPFLPTLVGLGLGAWLALFGLDGATRGAELWGMVLAVGSGVTWAIYTVLLRRHAPDVALRPLMVASFAVAFLFFAPLAILVDPAPAWRDVTPQGWLDMAVLVAGPSLASFFLFAASLQRAGAGAVNVLVGLEIAATLAFAKWLLGETLDAPRLVGVLIVLASVSAYLVWLARRVPHPPAAQPAGK